MAISIPLSKGIFYGPVVQFGMRPKSCVTESYPVGFTCYSNQYMIMTPGKNFHNRNQIIESEVLGWEVLLFGPIVAPTLLADMKWPQQTH